MSEVDRLARYPRSTGRGTMRPPARDADREVAKRFGQEYFDGTRTRGTAATATTRASGWAWPKTSATPTASRPARGCWTSAAPRGSCSTTCARWRRASRCSGWTSRSTRSRTAWRTFGRAWCVGPPQRLPFPDGAFDVVLCINTIHNLPLDLLQAGDPRDRAGQAAGRARLPPGRLLAQRAAAPGLPELAVDGADVLRARGVASAVRGVRLHRRLLLDAGGVTGAPTRVTVGVILLDEAGRVLMQLRDDIPTIADPGCWVNPGGVLDPGEAPEAGARRELLEETGYRAGPLVLAHERTLHRPGRVRRAPVLLRGAVRRRPAADLLRGPGATVRRAGDAPEPEDLAGPGRDHPRRPEPGVPSQRGLI